jgi:hypothetical protein
VFLTNGSKNARFAGSFQHLSASNALVAHRRYPAVNNPGDYTQIYPEDEYMEEMSDNARVWRVYNDEADRTDMEMVDGWKGTLDTLLIFVSATVGWIYGIIIGLCRPVYSQLWSPPSSLKRRRTCNKITIKSLSLFLWN